MHAVLADSCIRLMSDKLKRDICDLRLPSALVGEYHHRIEQCISRELQYACQFWVQHLQRSETSLLDDGQEHKFLKDHLLHWLEALSLMGKTSESVLMITFLETLTRVSN